MSILYDGFHGGFFDAVHVSKTGNIFAIMKSISVAYNGFDVTESFSYFSASFASDGTIGNFSGESQGALPGDYPENSTFTWVSADIGIVSRVAEDNSTASGLTGTILAIDTVGSGIDGARTLTVDDKQPYDEVRALDGDLIAFVNWDLGVADVYDYNDSLVQSAQTVVELGLVRDISFDATEPDFVTAPFEEITESNVDPNYVFVDHEDIRVLDDGTLIKFTNYLEALVDYAPGQNPDDSSIIETYTAQEVATILSGVDDMVPDDGEHIIGDSDDDRIEGTNGDDRIEGLDGDDRLIGGAGNDVMEGDRGNNVLFGQQGDDILYGGAGDNYVDGGVGDDIIYGWGGTDLLQGDNGSDTIYARSDQATILVEGIEDDVDRTGELDTIHDFTLGIDKIEIKGQSFDTADDVAAFLDTRVVIEDANAYLTLDDGRQILLLDVVEEDADEDAQMDALVAIF